MEILAIYLANSLTMETAYMYHKNWYSEKVPRYVSKQKRTTIYRFYRPPLYIPMAKISHLSHLMEKPTICICENKDADRSLLKHGTERNNIVYKLLKNGIRRNVKLLNNGTVTNVKLLKSGILI